MNVVLFSLIDHFMVLQIRRELNLVGGDVFSANSSNRFFHQRDGEVGNTDLTRQPLFFASSSACINSSTDTASFGDGQWISVRST